MSVEGVPVGIDSSRDIYFRELSIENSPKGELSDIVSICRFPHTPPSLHSSAPYYTPSYCRLHNLGGIAVSVYYSF